ncbi:MAG TPA: carboxypeptidase regulatory-like domain-containing protein [Bryobacteraceae bacterium]|nr:carboxypeptidase regulatory-like domain-containing protein [Bryobacteraceae bacterium]
MLAKSRGYISFGIFLSLCAGAAWAQVAAIEGDVKGPDGKPIQNAQILIERTDMKGTYKGAKTDKKGHYIYNGLPSQGTYNVSVLMDGQVKQHIDGVRTRLGDPVPVNFDLKAAADQAGAQGAESADRSMSKEQKEALEKRSKENAAILAKNKALNDAFNAGKEALTAKNYDAAIESFQKGVELDANQHVIWANLADAYTGLASTKTGADQQAALDKSLDAFQKAIALKADDPAYHNNYALALARSKKFDDAQTELNKAAQLDPPNAGKYYYNLGALLVNSGQTAASEEAFKKAIQANPDYADAQFQYATALSAKLTTGPDGKIVAPAGMKEALDKYLELQPSGQFADAAKGMLQMIGATIQTNYSNPNAPKKAPAPTKKK